MNRKALMPIIALTFFTMMIISPATAITKTSYWEHVEGAVTGDPRKVINANRIMILQDLPYEGSYEGTLGTGTMKVCFEHLMVNTETGKGTAFATWTIIIGENTLSGSASGRITGGLSGTSEGHFRGTHGTGAFEGIIKWGNYSVNLATGVLDAEGVIIYH